jgi:hypothetical protein
MYKDGQGQLNIRVVNLGILIYLFFGIGNLGYLPTLLLISSLLGFPSLV